MSDAGYPIGPGYSNQAMDRDFFLRLEPGKRVEIPTKQDENFHGNLWCLPIVPGKNIAAELEYGGPIECRKSGPKDPMHMLAERYLGRCDYPAANPLFSSECLQAGGSDGAYRFRTMLPGTSYYTFPSVSRSKALTPGSITSDYVVERQLPEDLAAAIGKPGNLEELLFALNVVIAGAYTGSGREDGFETSYDFDTLVQELSQDGFNGDCKAASTLACGLLNASGLPARRIEGFVCRPEDLRSGRGETASYDGGHFWAETYIQLDKSKGFWVPVDPMLGGPDDVDPSSFHPPKAYPPAEGMVYAYDRVPLPRFLDPGVKAAGLKISYV